MPPPVPPPAPDPISATASGPAGCTIVTELENGTPVCIRTITPGDNALMRAGIARMSQRSRYLRFFSGGATPPDWVIDRLLDADGVKHMAWGAIDLAADGQPAIGAVHAFRNDDDPDCAEFSIAILDEWHGLGLGKLLTATILLDAQAEGIERFHVETLHENRSAIDFVRSIGGRQSGTADVTIPYTLDVSEALAVLEQEADPPGMARVFAVLRPTR
ncbi:GNAT family N-acetyltransferase [Qipengyuania oceanensis]|uniref:GNAT family N-acetyltransferase n=1 Tax=Qipengyuania oceanensis TaxID=1463597 RepID=UPI001925617D|nr:GNAT family N-acetyltransferase [Qipengyuania oceanensis]